MALGNLLFFVRNGAQRDNGVAYSVLELARKAIAGAQGLEIGSGRHDDLQAALLADVKADVKHAVAKFQDRGFSDVKNSIETVGWHGSDTFVRDSATRNSASGSVFFLTQASLSTVLTISGQRAAA